MPLSASEAERASRVLTRNIAKRDAIVAQVSLLHDLAQKIENDTDVLPLFRARKRDIDSLLNQFNSEQDAILDLLIQLQRESEYAATHAPIGVTLHEYYYFIMAISEELHVDAHTTINSGVTNTSGFSHVQLPKIQIPKFDGDILQWITFRDTYKSLVHDNTNLTNIEKYHYLVSAVGGSASAVVRSVGLSDSNYEVAWKALLDRFDNTRLIMNSHMDKIFNFSPIRSSSLCDLRQFLDTFQENIAALRRFAIADKEGYILFYIASRVLDSNTKCLFESQHDNTTLPVIDDLLKYVQTRCQVLQNSSVSSTLLSPSKSKPAFPTKRNSMVTQTSLVTNASNPTKACYLCNGPHFLYRCDKFLQQSVANRLKSVQSHRLCRNCLSATHDISRCTSKYSCRQCSAKHHSLLHFDTTNPEGASSVKDSNVQSPSKTPSTQTSDPASSVFVGTASCANLNILGTARICIQNNYGQWIPCRALINSGSQVSAITHNCASQLGLTRRRSTMRVAGLSQTSISQGIKGVTTCRFVAHTTPSTEYLCEAIILHKITGILPSDTLDPCIRSHYSHLQFADPSFDVPGRIDFLLGADVYNQIFADGYRVQHSPGFPSAFETQLGWIFMGTTPRYTASLPQKSLTLCVQQSMFSMSTPANTIAGQHQLKFFESATQSPATSFSLPISVPIFSVSSSLSTSTPIMGSTVPTTKQTCNASTMNPPSFSLGVPPSFGLSKNVQPSNTTAATKTSVPASFNLSTIPTSQAPSTQVATGLTLRGSSPQKTNGSVSLGITSTGGFSLGTSGTTISQTTAAITTKLQRVIDYMRRFVHTARGRKSQEGYLRHTARDQSLLPVIKMRQEQYFYIIHQNFVSSSSKTIPKSLARLAPYIDDCEVIRVSGRLRHSELQGSTKHPIILPKDSTLSKMLIRPYHVQYLRVGPQLVSSSLLQRHCMVSAQSVIRRLIFQCVTCTRHRPIIPLSYDPHDLRPLTPGHALIGTPIVAIPEPNLEAEPLDRLRHWQLLSDKKPEAKNLP